MLQSETISKYDTYKDSGIEWIGEIPQEWELIRLKQHYQFEKGKNAAIYTNEYIGSHEGEYPVYSGQTENDGIMGNVNTYDYDEPICVFTTTVGAKVMSPKILSGKFCLSQNCVIMKKIGTVDERFLYYQLLSLFNYEKSLIPFYMQPSLRISDLKKYIVISCKEQQQIADYLDKKCGDIDKVVETEKEVIEKLKEYKQSIITEAVTKGLDKNVTFKDSGIEWIGKIPQHWKLVRLKYKFRIKKDIAGKEGYDVLSVTQKGLKIKDLSNNEGQLAMDYSKYQLVEPFDFVMNHMDLLTGWVDCSQYSGVTSPDYRVFVNIDKQNCDNEYYKNVFQTCYRNKIFFGLGQGVSDLGRWRLQADKFLNFNIPIPPIDEQKEINDFITKKCTEIDKAISDKEQVIEKFTEYKKSLIYECVTGKRKVI